jgi:uncharacterized RDD family membrane protein YckC
MIEPQHFRSEKAGDPVQPNADVWRNEIRSRVSRYRTRRGRRVEGAFSMRFPFPPAEFVTVPHAVDSEVVSPVHDLPVAELTSKTQPTASFVSMEELPQPEPTSAEDRAEAALEPRALEVKVEAEPSVEPAPASLPEPEPEPDLPPVIQQRPRPKRKVIAFPRPAGAGASEAAYRLADPVLPEQPRILDIPEELEAFPSTPFLDGLQFEAAEQTPGEHVELPFRVVGRPQRIYSALVDCSVVAVAATVFAFICHEMLPNLVLSKQVLLTAGVVPVLLWGIYQYLLLVCAGRTAGMQVAGIRLSTFQGTRPSLRNRRNRVVGLYLSSASLMMGLLWAFVDVDALCWHDRISGTYLTKSE